MNNANEKKDQKALAAILSTADLLCTAVISGQPGQMRMALELAGALSSFKRLNSTRR